MKHRIFSLDFDGCLWTKQLEHTITQELSSYVKRKTDREIDIEVSRWDAIGIKDALKKLEPTEEATAQYKHEIEQIILDVFFNFHDPLYRRLMINKEDANTVMVGSNRQNTGADINNSQSKHIPSCFPLIKHLASRLECHFDTWLTADLEQRQPLEFDYAIDRMQRDKDRMQRDSELSILCLPKDKQNKRDNRIHPFDDTKITQIYAQMHRAAFNPLYYDKSVEFNFVDDREDILDAIYKTFTNHAVLIPKGMTLRLHQYSTELDQTKEYLPIIGTGKPDYNYSSTIKQIYDDHSKSQPQKTTRMNLSYKYTIGGLQQNHQALLAAQLLHVQASIPPKPTPLARPMQQTDPRHRHAAREEEKVQAETVDAAIKIQYFVRDHQSRKALAVRAEPRIFPNSIVKQEQDLLKNIYNTLSILRAEEEEMRPIYDILKRQLDFYLDNQPSNEQMTQYPELHHNHLFTLTEDAIKRLLQTRLQLENKTLIDLILRNLFEFEHLMQKKAIEQISDPVRYSNLHSQLLKDPTPHFDLIKKIHQTNRIENQDFIKNASRKAWISCDEYVQIQKTNPDITNQNHMSTMGRGLAAAKKIMSSTDNIDDIITVGQYCAETHTHLEQRRRGNLNRNVPYSQNLIHEVHRKAYGNCCKSSRSWRHIKAAMWGFLGVTLMAGAAALVIASQGLATPLVLASMKFTSTVVASTTISCGAVGLGSTLFSLQRSCIHESKMEKLVKAMS